VGRKTAHQWLKELRENEEDVDLTHDHRPWRSYLVCHSQGEIVVGPGIAQFLFRFLNTAWDSNTLENRADFVVRRIDGTDVRLHPGSSYNAQPVFGQLQQWLRQDAIHPAAPQRPRLGPAAPPPRDTTGDVARLA